MAEYVDQPVDLRSADFLVCSSAHHSGLSDSCICSLSSFNFVHTVDIHTEEDFDRQ